MNKPFLYDATKIAKLCMLMADVRASFVASECTNPTKPAILPGSDLANDWTILGYLIADREPQQLNPADKHTACFGVLARSKTPNMGCVVIMRGTVGWREWADNVKVGKTVFPKRGMCTPGALVCHPEKGFGQVEEGFFETYASLRYLPVDSDCAVFPAWKGVAEAINPNEFLFVAGHSLGAVQATYLTLDLQTLAQREAVGIYVASPKPGDAEFAKAFDGAVPEYAVYEYVRDIVPDLPPSILGYRTLPRLVQITVQSSDAIIKDEVGANHHSVCYAAMLDYDLHTAQEWRELLIRNDDGADDIQGPAHPLEKTA